MVIHWCGSVKMRISTENNRKFLCSSSAILPHRTRGPVQRRNCLSSVAFHQLTSAIVLGFLANSIGIDFLKISKKSDIFCCTFPPILTFSGPYTKQNEPFYDIKTHKVHIVNWKLTDHANR